MEIRNLTEEILRLPKAELHLHIEGTLEPEMLFALANRNGVALAYDSVASLRAAYDFRSLQDFLDLYYAGMSVLQTEQDFFDLTWAYLQRCAQQHVVHAEIFFDPQGHTEREIAIDTVISGIEKACRKAANAFGISTLLIPNFLRHLSEESALTCWEALQPHLDKIVGIGLDSSEMGHPPSKFERVFAKVREAGLKVVAHAGEEGPPDYIWQAIKLLKVDRIDHGVRCLEDDQLVSVLADTQLPLTVCPLSNVRLCVFDDLQQHNLRQLLDKRLCATVNSDDPAYFGGYLNENLQGVVDALALDLVQLKTLLKNSFTASFLPDRSKVYWCTRIDEMM